MQQFGDSAGSDDDQTTGLAVYRGCWMALIGDQVAGVGQSAEAAQLAARHSRPRERITALIFVPEDSES